MTNIIQKLTKGYTGDCAISNLGGSATCMHWEPVYNKMGNRIDNGDPNIYTTHYKCGFCGMKWTVKSQKGKADEIFPKLKNI